MVREYIRLREEEGLTKHQASDVIEEREAAAWGRRPIPQSGVHPQYMHKWTGKIKDNSRKKRLRKSTFSKNPSGLYLPPYPLRTLECWHNTYVRHAEMFEGI